MTETKVTHLSVSDRNAQGKEARDRSPLKGHSGWAAGE